MYAKAPHEGYTDGYLRLAEAIIEQAAKDYSMLFPLTARTKSEYETLDIVKGYARERERILRSLCNGGVKTIVDYDICKAAFDQRLEIEKQKMGIYW